MFVLVLLILSRLFTVDCAPKLGHMLFDPLVFEASKHIMPGAEPPKFDHSNDDDFLENEPSKEKTRESRSPPIVINQINIERRTNDQITTKEEERALLYKTYKTSQSDFGKSAARQGGSGDVAKFGYDFDPSLCVQINSENRIICGYNKNVGEIPKEHPIIPTANDCQIRAGRIECGYVKGGYVMARRKALSFIPIETANTSPMPRVTNPKVSPLLLSTYILYQTNATSKSTSSFKVIENLQSLREIIRTPDLQTSELTSGIMTTPLLTSRSGIISSKITAENRHDEIKGRIPSIMREVVPSPKLDKETTLVENKEQTTADERPIARTKDNVKAEDNFGGCSSCVLRSFMNKDALRQSDDELKTTNDYFTRCVEIQDRIVCYPLKNTTAAP